MVSWMDMVAIGLAAFALALAALIGFALIDRRRGNTLRQTARAERDRMIFLFDGPHLLDATPPARELLAAASSDDDGQPGWGQFARILRPRFAGLDQIEAHLAEAGEIELTSRDHDALLRAEWVDGGARIELTSRTEMATPDPHVGAALQDELATLREVATHVPYLTWRESPDGQITWANKAYLDLAAKTGPDTEVRPWPPARLFQAEDLSSRHFEDGPHRAQITLGDITHWFELHRHDAETGVQFTALPADDAVRAETTLSEFFSTLTKTFAQLPVGLAIFDRERRLSLFNPALTDLTMLPVDFLCGQPTLAGFLDALRERRMMPEPKNYKSWRKQVSELEADATSGAYRETWHLPTGQTYRVTGRPHPGGAIAFLFEDVTSEISLTRRFQSEIEIGQAALDAMRDAVAVFNQAGVVTLTNRAYGRLWGETPETGLLETSAGQLARTWQAACQPTPVWDRILSEIGSSGARQVWQAPITMADGRTLMCRISPMPAGGTMVAFESVANTANALASTRQGLLATPDQATGT